MYRMQIKASMRCGLEWGGRQTEEGKTVRGPSGKEPGGLMRCYRGS